MLIEPAASGHFTFKLNPKCYSIKEKPRKKYQLNGRRKDRKRLKAKHEKGKENQTPKANMRRRQQ